MEEKQAKLDKTIELVIVILLGVTALLTAWASWIGSLHGGNQATNYAKSNNLSSEGNSEYNAAIQTMNQDMLLWNAVSDLQIEISATALNEDELALTQCCYQLYFKLQENLSERMADYIGWTFEDGDPKEIVLAWLEDPRSTQTPFSDQDYVDGYLEKANVLLAESQAVLEQGQRDNGNGDAFGLVTVIYSVVLFLLGIAGTFEHRSNKYALIGISAVAFLIATIYMFTIPMPTGFSLAGFFGAG